MWSACHKKSYLTNLEVRNLKSAVSALCSCLSFACFEKKWGKVSWIFQNSSIRHITNTFSYDMLTTLKTKKCCWHVIRKVIWRVTKLGIFEILCNIYLFSSSCLCPVCCLSFVIWKKKTRNSLFEYSKVCNFVTYQITFLMTCQQH